MIKKSLFFLLINLFLVFVLSIADTNAQTKQSIVFAKSTSSATVKGTIRGYKYIDYTIAARAGQRLEIDLSAVKTVPVFTVFLPNGDNLEDAAQRNEFSGLLPENGTYVIRVGLMRAAARRKNSSAAFTLKVSIQ